MTFEINQVMAWLKEHDLHEVPSGCYRIPLGVREEEYHVEVRDGRIFIGARVADNSADNPEKTEES